MDKFSSNVERAYQHVQQLETFCDGLTTAQPNGGWSDRDLDAAHQIALNERLDVVVEICWELLKAAIPQLPHARTAFPSFWRDNTVVPRIEYGTEAKSATTIIDRLAKRVGADNHWRRIAYDLIVLTQPNRNFSYAPLERAVAFRSIGAGFAKPHAQGSRIALKPQIYAEIQNAVAESLSEVVAETQFVPDVVTDIVDHIAMTGFKVKS